ncbi:MAG: Gldg family protein, partial [Pseudomonadota bacterium]
MIRKISTTFNNKSFIKIIAILVIFIAVNLVFNISFRGISFDLTSNKIYTLSDGTKNILANIDEPINLKFFYSEKLATNIPLIHSYAERIKGLLNKYQNIAKNQVTVEFIDPEPFSKSEDEATSLGVQPIPLDDLGNNLYFGLVASNSVDEIKEIPFFDPARETFLEYDLTKIIYDLSAKQKTKIGLISNIDFMQANYNQPYGNFGNKESWTIIEQIKEIFEIVEITSDTKIIPDNINNLLIIDPSDMSAELVYAIDQFIVKGGNALIAVDPKLELTDGKQNIDSDLSEEINGNSENISKLLEIWGVGYDANLVALDATNATRVQNNQSDSILQAISKLNWLKLEQSYLNNDDVITSELASINYISGGHFTDKKLNNIAFTPLLSTSENTMLVTGDLLEDSEELLSNFVSSGQKLMLAARLRGKFNSAFSDDYRDESNNGANNIDNSNISAENIIKNGKDGQYGKDGNHISKSEQYSNIILLADIDMLRDQFWVKKQNFFGQNLVMKISDNGAFIINALDNLSGSDDLINLRSRGEIKRSFIVVDELRHAAEKRFLVEEKRLQMKLQDSEEKLLALQNSAPDSSEAIFNKQQQLEIDSFRNEILNTRQELRDVQHKLQQEIDQLGGFLKLL